MRTFLDALRELAAPQLLVDGPLVLREHDRMSTCSPIKIEQAGGQAIALRLEPRCFRGGPELPVNEWLFPLFNTSLGKPPLCRSCDYIIFFGPRSHEHEVFVFLCELKSNSTSGAWTQLRNGFLLAQYLLKVVELHGEVHPWPTVHIRGIVFSENAPSRRGTLKVPGRLDWRRDDLTGLDITSERARGGHFLQTFCI